MKIRNFTALKTCMALQGLMKKVYESRSAILLTAGFSRQDGNEFLDSITVIKNGIVTEEENTFSILESVDIAPPEAYVPGHPNMTVDYIGRGVEATIFYIINKSRSANLMESGFLADEANRILEMIGDLEIKFRSEPVPYPRVEYAVEKVSSLPDENGTDYDKEFWGEEDHEQETEPTKEVSDTNADTGSPKLRRNKQKD